MACYLGFVTQAISANFTPLLFLTFKDTYEIGLEKIALIPLVFYLTQLLIDFAATKFVDKIGYRTCVVISQAVSAVGLAAFPILGLAGCALCGLAVGIMWPGLSLITLNRKFNRLSKSKQ